VAPDPALDGNEFGPPKRAASRRDTASRLEPRRRGTAKAHQFGGGNARPSGEGWDEE